MKDSLTLEQYKQGLEQFISATTASMPSNDLSIKTIYVGHQMDQWFLHNSTSKLFSNIGAISSYLEFAYNAGDISLTDESLNGLHFALFDLAQGQKTQKEFNMLESVSPENPFLNNDYVAFKEVLPEWLDNFADGFDVNTNTFTLPKLVK